MKEKQTSWRGPSVSLFISSMTAAPSWALNLSPCFPFNTWLVTFSISSSHFQGFWFRVSLLHLLPKVCIPWMGSFHSLPWWTHLPTASLCCQGKHPETQPSLFRLPLISRGLLGEIHIQKALCSGKHGSPHQAHLPSSLPLHMGHLSDSARHTTSWSFHSSKPLNEPLPLQNILLQHSPPLLLQFVRKARLTPLGSSPFLPSPAHGSSFRLCMTHNLLVLPQLQASEWTTVSAEYPPPTLSSAPSPICPSPAQDSEPSSGSLFLWWRLFSGWLFPFPAKQTSLFTPVSHLDPLQLV